MPLNGFRTSNPQWSEVQHAFTNLHIFFKNIDPAIVLDKHNQYLAQIPHIKYPKTTLDDQLAAYIYIVNSVVVFS